jgi:predicted DNA-binding transcriptional regulator AlpA
MPAMPEVTGRRVGAGEYSDDHILTLAEFRELARISKATVTRMIAAGKAPRLIRLGEKKLGVRYGDYVRWLGARAINSEAA